VSKVLARILRDIDALQLPQKLYGLDFTHPRFIEQVLQTETEIHYWTINEPALMQELFALGAHGIVTDRTDLARRAFN
jgi:glycerophosphoryl diester phosphodiesterase